MKVSLVGTLGLFLLLGAEAAQAGPVIGGTAYALAGASETVTAPFLTPDSVVTSGLYRGLVAITVSGTGQSNGTALNDAFYAFDNVSFSTPGGGYYQLTVGTAALIGFAPSQDARNYIVYDLDANVAATPPYAPAYNANHVYDVVIDTGTTTLSALHFGVSDGNFGDNAGAYTITVTQLVAVPEPGSLAVLATGLMLARRRRR